MGVIDQQRLVVSPGVYLDGGPYAVEVVLAASFERRGELYLEPTVCVAAFIHECNDAASGEQYEIQVAVIVQVAGFHVFDGRTGRSGQQRRLFLEPAVPKVSDQPQSRPARHRSAGERHDR